MRLAIGRFANELRGAGIRISIAETIDAVEAAAVAGVERDRLREALAATLVKDETDRGTFDEAFDRFFTAGRPERERKAKRAAGGDEPGERRGRGQGEGRGPPPIASPETPPETPPGARSRSASPRPPDSPGSERSAPLERRRRARALLAKSFREIDPLEADSVAELADELARRFRGRLRRRLRRDRRGRLDFRRTFRRAVARGGVAFDLELRRRRPGRVDVVALCDVSGSVRLASDLFAAVLGPCADRLRSLRVVVFVDRPVAAGIEDGRLAPAAPVDFHAFSDFGRVFVEIERSGEPALGRNTLLLVLGDARNNRKPARADALARIRRRVKALWWLVPEARARWGTGDSALPSYAPHCDAVLECASPAALVAALDGLPVGR